MKIKASDVGRWVLVDWDDVGRQEAVLVDFDPPRVYAPHEDGTVSIDSVDQIVEIGPYLARHTR